MNTYLILGLAIVAEVIATSALKAADGFTRTIPSVMVVLGYAVAFYCLSITLRTIPIGIVYAVWSGAGIILLAAIGWVFYGQKLDAAALVGLTLIIAGVLIVNLVSKTAGH
jgi:small multidrug resistance pump